MLRVLLVLVLLALYISFIVDVVRAPGPAVRALPKTVWFLIVVVAPLVGGLAWLAFGRPRYATQPRPWSRRQVAPDDDPRFLRELDEQAWRERMKRRRGETSGE